MNDDKVNSDQKVRHHNFSDLLLIMGQSKQIEGLHVYLMENEKKEIPFTYPFRTDHISVLMVTAGKLQIKLNLIDYTIHPGELITLSPEAVCQILAVTDTVSMSCISFSQDFLLKSGINQKYIAAFDLWGPQISPYVILSPDEEKQYVAMVKMLHANLVTRQKSEFSHEIIQHTFNLFCYELASIFFSHNSLLETSLARKEDLASRFMKMLLKYYREQRSVQFYAELLSVTPRYLTQTIKESVGKTAGQLIDEMVITEAMILLNDASLSIGQVASTLQFSDQFFFSKFFKKHTRYTPSEYRKNKPAGISGGMSIILPSSIPSDIS